MVAAMLPPRLASGARTQASCAGHADTRSVSGRIRGDVRRTAWCQRRLGNGLLVPAGATRGHGAFLSLRNRHGFGTSSGPSRIAPSPATADKQPPQFWRQAADTSIPRHRGTRRVTRSCCHLHAGVDCFLSSVLSLLLRAPDPRRGLVWAWGLEIPLETLLFRASRGWSPGRGEPRCCCVPVETCSRWPRNRILGYYDELTTDST